MSQSSVGASYHRSASVVHFVSLSAFSEREVPELYWLLWQHDTPLPWFLRHLRRELFYRFIKFLRIIQLNSISSSGHVIVHTKDDTFTPSKKI